MPNREAVIAIQGGGVFGLTVLGQLHSVLVEHKYNAMALAGTSAGAIVAALTWAGFKPGEIQDKFKGLHSNSGTRLTHLLGPCDDGFDYAAFCELKEEVQETIQKLTYSELSRWQKLKLAYKILALWAKVTPHYKRRGVFPGAALEDKLEEWLREKIPLPNSCPPGTRLCFAHVEQLMRADLETHYRPPLLLTVTNLTRRRVELVSSLDTRYAHVSIAKAVRASAGFPVFFTPLEMAECHEGKGCWFVDGGLVSNFPMWAFSDAFRIQIRNSSMSDIYGHVADRPWIRIGLRVVDDLENLPDLSAPSRYVGSLLRMLAGGTRNELERILSSTAPRAIFIEQPYSTTDGPKGVLEVDQLTTERIDSMIVHGQQYANEELKAYRSPGVITDDEGLSGKIERQLKDLISRCEEIFQPVPREALRLRANIFMPALRGDDLVMRIRFACNMNGDSDADMEFADLRSGLTGFCYSTRKPQICNLEVVAKLRMSEWQQTDLFGMNPDLQRKVRDDRTWLVSVPIFDPYEVCMDARGKRGRAHEAFVRAAYFSVETEIDGPILGVLNLDAGWSYTDVNLPGDVNLQITDTRIQILLALLHSASFRIASTLSEDFHDN